MSFDIDSAVYTVALAALASHDDALFNHLYRYAEERDVDGTADERCSAATRWRTRSSKRRL